MARYSGIIGYVERDVETAPGVFEEKFIERHVTGTTTQISLRHSESNKMHDDLSLQNTISFIGDTFSFENIASMRYATFMSSNKWKITDVRVDRPRITITLGEVWNE